MKHFIFQQDTKNQKQRFFLDNDDGIIYINFEAVVNGKPVGYSISINEFERELDKFKSEIETESNNDVKQVLLDFQKSLDNVLKLF